MMDAARQVGVATRVSTKYWAEHIGRPYQPPETFALFGYQALLAKPRPYDLFWEIWGLGSHRILLWGSPDFARRIVSTVTLSNTLGFEVDAPPTQKGYGNRPGRWDVFNDAQSARKFWHWDFERYWFFYLLWGRLSYNPATPDAVWMHEMQVRFGAAAPDERKPKTGAEEKSPVRACGGLKWINHLSRASELFKLASQQRFCGFFRRRPALEGGGLYPPGFGGSSVEKPAFLPFWSNAGNA